MAVTRKLSTPMSGDDALQALQRLAVYSTVQIDATLIIRAAERYRRDMLSFRDGLIVEAALAGGATRLLSEDLQHGREVAGLVIENPFRS